MAAPRAMIVGRPGSPDVLSLGALPERGASLTDVRVAVQACGVNPVDAGNRADPTWAGITPPFVPGYEFAGHVLEAGSDVNDLQVGDAVWGLLPVRGTRWGAYAEEVIADARFVDRRPGRLSAIEAAALPLAGATALQLLERLQPTAGEWLLIHGAAGGVGHLLVQLARMDGARVAAPASSARQALLRDLGVEVIVDRHGSDALKAARDAAGTDFATVADLVGGLVQASLAFTAEGGRVGSIVDLTGDFEEAVDRNITMHGVLVRAGREPLASLRALVEAGSVRPIIDEVLDLRDAHRAHQRVETGSGQGKVVLVVER